jgi:uncharacterized protein YndB with AHSA1/START domain
MANYVATAETEINASPAQVWAALTDPELIKQYMFGAQVETDWHPGSPIVWKGEYDGKAYQDKGEIIEIDPNLRLKVTHFSPLSGQQDVPGNYHTLLYELEGHGNRTRISLSQDNNPSEQEAEHAQANWKMMLDSMKTVIERG